MDPYHDNPQYQTDFPSEMPPDLRKAIEAIVPSARSMLEETGDMPPVLNVREYDNLLAFSVGAYMKNQSTKDRLSKVMEAASRKPGVRWLCLVSEVWVGAERNMKSHLDVPLPSEDPRRTEAVSFMVSSPEGDWMGLAPILRPEGKPPTFDKVYWNRKPVKTEGRFAGFYRKEGSA